MQLKLCLRREGVHIHRQMFELLLERRALLLLFDGLDEVPTLDERRRLVRELEDFASHHPGNRILVTSRTVGYDLADLSNQYFLHAQIEDFNDKQIRQFLENWYTHVLGLSPIPYEDQQEMHALYTLLKENSWLHPLAANPLLITVVIALQRYERLPSRRVLIYDRCADLLLETWAKLKGTDIRWKDLKMAKEDQYACIAHLGFILHEISGEKENQSGDNIKDITESVSAKLILREIEYFLSNRGLITEVAERRIQALRFLELIQAETGLIVERGIDENGSSLYGFALLIFQEYFAAANVYELYLEEDINVISNFLREHLHDSHWQEVILLLLGKLKSKSVSYLLRQILEGKIKSYRSEYTNIVQQDLFFISSCLAEEIYVEKELAMVVISRLSDVMKNSPFTSQSDKALEALTLLMQTRLYAALAREELIALATQIVENTSRSIHAIEILYKQSIEESEKQQVRQIFLNMVHEPDLSLEQIIQISEVLYENSPHASQEAVQDLWSYIQDQNSILKQRLRALAVLILASWVSYIDKAQAVEIIYNQLPKEEAKLFLAEYWQSSYVSAELSTIPYIVELVKQELLPSEVRDNLYQLVSQMVLEFNKLNTLSPPPTL
jgi:NACHT domain